MGKSRSKQKRNVISTFLEAILTGASLVSVVALWTSAASIYVNPVSVKLAAVAGLGFPLALAGTLGVLLLSLLFAPRTSWICLLGLVCSFGSIRSYFPINPFPRAASDSTLVVMNYNVFGFYNCKEEDDRKAFLSYLYSKAPDVICFQEGSAGFKDWCTLDSAFHHRLPYVETTDKAPVKSVVCVSRFPVVKTELVTEHTQNSVVAFWLQMPKGDTLLVVNCHLQSNELTPADRQQYSDIVHHPKQSSQQTDSTYMTSRGLMQKIASAAQIRAAMSDTIADFLQRHRALPTVVCGDFNDTPISYSCFKIKSQGLSDAFRMAGNGMGRSFNKDAIAVRIDHQFCSSHFTPVTSYIDNTALWSDHYPLVTTYNINPK